MSVPRPKGPVVLLAIVGAILLIGVLISQLSGGSNDAQVNADGTVTVTTDAENPNPDPDASPDQKPDGGADGDLVGDKASVTAWAEANKRTIDEFTGQYSASMTTLSTADSVDDIETAGVQMQASLDALEELESTEIPDSSLAESFANVADAEKEVLKQINAYTENAAIAEDPVRSVEERQGALQDLLIIQDRLGSAAEAAADTMIALQDTLKAISER